ncbi:Sigma factor binding protein 1, chloroplastic [Capsicum baccatum]|uniref:Sigma factor binding protein 1, chloroplastic n=1 Tax=Capsicum baccatum TaxID=33114 RepID=A0A2G2W6X7_CAPBA|nr:Sigma factor binding protein 1, chloroplastic [Capsicum baccatum]
MDYRGVMMTKCKNTKQRKRDHHKSKKSDVKVVYISTPMKVKTSASRFRSLVQELTGQDSDIARIMESNNGAITEFEDIHHGHNDQIPVKSSSPSPSPSSSSSLLLAKSSNNSSPMSSESNYFKEPNFDDLLNTQMEEQYLALLGSSNYSSSDYSADIDVLGSYDALL